METGVSEILTGRELERYRRQLMLPGFSRHHQEKLKQSTAMIAGIGGLGGTAAAYLAVAGVGRMVFVHSGTLTLSNMNRQIMMKHEGIGSSRVVQGAQFIRELNPDVAVEIHDERMDEVSVGRLLSGVHVALSARPNFEERSVLNRACIAQGIPMIEAAMNGMEGYLLNVIPGITPCLHCVFPESNPEWEELGFPVLGAVSGLLGCLMAIEAIKLVTGYGSPLQNRMLSFNTMSLEFQRLRIHRNPTCGECGGNVS